MARWAIIIIAVLVAAVMTALMFFATWPPSGYGFWFLLPWLLGIFLICEWIDRKNGRTSLWPFVRRWLQRLWAIFLAYVR